MKVHWQTTALLLAASAAARDATVHILGAPSSKDTTPPSVLDASSARLVFAQLLGLSEFHNLGDVSSDTLQGLNAFSAGPQALFGQESAINQQRSFVIVEGYDHVKDILPTDLGSSATRFTIADMPAPNFSDELLQNFKTQNEWSQRRQRLRASKGSPAPGVTSLHASKLAKGHAGSDAHVRTRLEKLAKQDGIRIILVAQPERSISKRSSVTWGSYTTPHLSERQSSEEILEELDEEVEEILEDLEMRPNRLSGSRPIPILGDLLDDVVNSQQQDNHTAPRGILPSCYASQAECDRTTNKCSGHGSCKSKYKYKEGSNTRQCFACSCTPTVEKVSGGGSSTTQWAGPACQKIDVSEPFWILAGVTIFLLLIVSGGIGMLMSMGSEELPSVIGAGVAGPRANK